MLTLQELLNGVKCLDENTLAELSDKLWELGTLDDMNVASLRSVKVATPPCAAYAAIPCGLAVRKRF